MSRKDSYKEEYEKNPRIQKVMRIFKKGKIVKIIDARDKENIIIIE